MKFLNYLSQIPPDKLGHIIVGLFIYSVLTIFIQPIFALYIVVAVGALKEIYDFFFPNHSCELLDFVATIALPTFLTLIFYFKEAHHVF